MLPAQRVRSHLLSPLALATQEEDQAERRRGQISGWLLAHLLTRSSSNPPSLPPLFRTRQTSRCVPPSRLLAATHPVPDLCSRTLLDLSVPSSLGLSGFVMRPSPPLPSPPAPQTMNEEEKKLFQLYGKLPAKKSNPLARMQVRFSLVHLSRAVWRGCL